MTSSPTPGRPKAGEADRVTRPAFVPSLPAGDRERYSASEGRS